MRIDSQTYIRIVIGKRRRGDTTTVPEEHVSALPPGVTAITDANELSVLQHIRAPQAEQDASVAKTGLGVRGPLTLGTEADVSPDAPHASMEALRNAAPAVPPALPPPAKKVDVAKTEPAPVQTPDVDRDVRVAPQITTAATMALTVLVVPPGKLIMTGTHVVAIKIPAVADAAGVADALAKELVGRTPAEIAAAIALVNDAVRL